MEYSSYILKINNKNKTLVIWSTFHANVAPLASGSRLNVTNYWPGEMDETLSVGLTVICPFGHCCCCCCLQKQALTLSLGWLSSHTLQGKRNGLQSERSLFGENKKPPRYFVICFHPSPLYAGGTLNYRTLWP